MKLKTNILFLISMLILSGNLACSKYDDLSSQMIIGQASESERLSPITIKNPQTFLISWQIFEGLLGLNTEGQIIPKLAERWETKDYRVWNFHIRRGVTFHKSEIFNNSDKTREVTSKDVLYSYTRFCSPEAYPSFVLADSVKGFDEYNKGMVDNVKGLKAIDKYIFQIELNTPEPFFINRISSPWLSIFPKEADSEPFKNKWGLTIAVGTGPFKLSSKTDNEIILVKNTNYWDQDRIPELEKLIYRINKNDQIRFAELTKGELDLMILPNHLFPTVFESNGKPIAKYNEQFNFKAISTFNHHLIGINSSRITDIHLRRAMYFGANREQIIQKILYGFADIMTGPIPPIMIKYKNLEKGAFDPIKAKRELEKSQYDGREIELLVHDLANSELISQVFQSQMKNIGINIKLIKVDFNSAIGRMVKGDVELFSMFAEIVFSSPEPLLINLFSTKKIPVPNFWHYSNDTVDKILDELSSISEKEISIRESIKLQEKIMEEVPAVFLYSQKKIVIMSKRFQNLEVNGNNYFFLENIKVVN